MLSKEKILKNAVDILFKEDFPIVVTSGRVVLPEEEMDDESKEFLNQRNIARVSFVSKYYDDPNDEYPCDPRVYIVYVDINTGEVYIPRHM